MEWAIVMYDKKRLCTVCFTGHRIIPQDHYETLKTQLTNLLENLINQDYCFFGCGGALGFDTLAALTVLKLQEKYPHIKLILVLPCHDQFKGWLEKDVMIFKDTLKRANKVVYVEKNYTPECMFKRNRHLIDNSSLCISYLTKKTGGTAYTVNYAKENGVTVINLGA